MLQTRRRIAEAALELHASVGPAETTIAAIAERAGVQRQTVYRHFPDDLALFEGCVELQVSKDPPPDPEPWRQIADPRERLTVALADVYAYFRRGENILANISRDMPALPALRQAHEGVTEHWVTLRDVLAEGWGVRGPRRTMLVAAIGHALEFTTWQSLVRRQGLSAKKAIAVMEEFIASIVGS
ncbi:MAG: helix-turn-helix domain-containing protein [Actinomycetota bacterium]